MSSELDASRGDRWLEPLLPLVLERAGALPVLELGCGRGVDSAVLAAAGCRVVGVDRSEPALAEARSRVPDGRFCAQDLREPFPLAPGATRVVVASLSLHYFGWADTLQLARRIHATLTPGGLLLCRLNSTRDRWYGAIGFPALERHYYRVLGKPKRFFDRADVEALFAEGWSVRELAEETIHRYALPKTVWRAVLDAL